MGGEAGLAEQKDVISTLHGKHQAFTVRPEADALYLVATDPRLVGQREVVSSDVLLDLLFAVPCLLHLASFSRWKLFSQIHCGANFSEQVITA